MKPFFSEKLELAHLEVCGYEDRENPDHGIIVEGRDTHDVEMTEEARCDGVPPTAGRSHGRYKLYILQCDLGRILQIVPKQIKKYVLGKFRPQVYVIF